MVHRIQFETAINSYRSKRQKRIMGVDSQKIYNKPRKESGIRSLKRSERLISDVLAVEIVPNKPSCFRIKWRDAGESER